MQAVKREHDVCRWRRTFMLAVTLVATTLTLMTLPTHSLAADLSGALVSSADCTENALARNDDGSTSSVDLPFAIDFFGERHESLWVNNNGNVTFDAALGTFTPFGLQAAQRAIIAPFFADVDTRASGSELVRYGWGETTFHGRRAFCANWVNVGYYNQRADKLNSFQLLLVDRSDVASGDFDIVFNYGSIVWETGDASGGSNGLGGESARVGFANGDGTTANSFELPGSGIDGSLLDSSSRGLIRNSHESSGQPGRYVYAIRNGRPGPSRYVALGDSYQSGEGAGSYASGTDSDGVNQCHRSANAYAKVLTDDGTIPFALDFVACSGAKISDVLETGQWNEPAQISRVTEDTALTTVGIGGNDLSFGPILKNCVTLRSLPNGSCEAAYDDDVVNALLDLQEHNTPDRLNRLQQLYDRIRSKAPRGKVLVLGYPRFFPIDGSNGLSGVVADIGSILNGDGFAEGRCANVRISDQLWIDYKITQLNGAVASSARSMGTRYVDIYTASRDHELCGEHDPDFLNGIVLSNTVESFHPTAWGQARIAERIRETLASEPDAFVYNIMPGERQRTTTTVPSGTPESSFSSEWPGSDVVMTLTSPSGRVISRSTHATDVFHRNGSTQELYLVSDPEPGQWTVELFGADVAPSGERTTLALYQAPPKNADPVAQIALSELRKDEISLDATASADVDGHVVEYLWDFGDGTYASGPQATHTYEKPGAYRVTLIVQDDRGALGFATADANFKITPYKFSGPSAPLDAGTVNAINAGRAVPVKFGLGGAQGLQIFDPGYPKVQRVDCHSGDAIGDATAAETAGSSGLTYSGANGQYHYVWQTKQAWAGSCRNLILGLDDATNHVLRFSLR